jgi:hypothetical protein
MRRVFQLRRNIRRALDPTEIASNGAGTRPPVDSTRSRLAAAIFFV